MLKMLFLLSCPLLLSTLKYSIPQKWNKTVIVLLLSTLLMIFLFFPAWPNKLTLLSFTSIDLMSAILTLLTIWVSSLMILSSYKILHMKNKPRLFLMTIILLMLSLYFCFLTNNLILFYIFFEASLIPTLLLILMWGYQPERLQAGMYLMLYTVTASLPLLLSLLLLQKSNFHLSMIYPCWSPPNMKFSILPIWWFITSLAFMVKMPIFLVHLWLPKAHVEAPVAGSMILAGVLLKLGSYGLIRLSLLMSFLSNKINNILSPLCMWGAILTSVICLRQPDLKALIAYSSIGHMGLLMAGMMTCSKWGWSGALTMMLAHGLCSSAMFLLANMTYLSTNTRSLTLTKGLLTVAPIMTLWWFLFNAINMAAPPSMNLLGEIILLTSILSKSITMMIPIALVSFLTGAYSLHLYTSTQHGPIPLFSNPMLFMSHTNFTQLTFHLIPLMLFMLKANLISTWLAW